ncbi:hypothetical protein CK203_095520 [Vitis vinifera]|uniref:Uncharacterized protein n=1 Tax=Vitis vinifera TaxID=29760 RepID=A0A438CJD2_VITVI|nr:hypothetical protein CK203_095520 [Vitis vinifera]
MHSNEARVANLKVRSNERGVWIPNFSKPLNDRDIEIVQCFLTRLQDKVVVVEGEDKTNYKGGVGHWPIDTSFVILMRRPHSFALWKGEGIVGALFSLFGVYRVIYSIVREMLLATLKIGTIEPIDTSLQEMEINPKLSSFFAKVAQPTKSTPFEKIIENLLAFKERLPTNYDQFYYFAALACTLSLSPLTP